MAYSDKVIDHFENPRNMGSMDKNDPDVVNPEVYNQEHEITQFPWQFPADDIPNGHGQNHLPNHRRKIVRASNNPAQLILRISH